MGLLKLTYKKKDSGREDVDYYLTIPELSKFNASILDLGDISKDGEYFEALSAIFDLEGFTSFCNQIDPHLVLPEYLSEFLKWLFQSILDEFVEKRDEEQAMLWCHLPFYAKFTGDGVLFLWETKNLEPNYIGNIVVNLRNICTKYREEFLPNIRKRVVKAPTKLRCGVARGQIISIGDGKDFVGPCINFASRLQKVGQFSFAFSKRGFDLERHFGPHAAETFTLIKLQIRGLGDEELLFVLKKEFDELPSEDKALLVP